MVLGFGDSDDEEASITTSDGRVTRAIQDAAFEGRYGVGFGLLEVGRRTGEAIPDSVDETALREAAHDRSLTDGVTADFAITSRDYTEYAFERTPGGRVASGAGETANNAADSVVSFGEELSDAIPSPNVLRAVFGIVAVLLGMIAAGQLFDVQLGN